MKKTVAMVILGLMVSWNAGARPSDAKPHADLAAQGDQLREQMVQFLVSMSDLDAVVNRDQEIDYDLFMEDAQRILSTIDRVRKIDTAGVFKKELDKLEKLNKKFYQYSMEHNPKAAKYPEQIFNVCFECHRVHRDNVVTP